MIENLTPAEYNRELTVRVVKTVNHLANIMNECYHLFWSRDKQEILDSLNSNLEITLERFKANSELGAAINLQLGKTDFLTRVIVSMPEGYTNDGKAFAYNPPVVIIEESLAL